jgi:hypothetical protein
MKLAGVSAAVGCLVTRLGTTVAADLYFGSLVLAPVLSVPPDVFHLVAVVSLLGGGKGSCHELVGEQPHSLEIFEDRSDVQ